LRPDQQNVFIDAELELNFAGQRIRQRIQGDYSLHRETDNCPADGKFDNQPEINLIV